MIPIAEPLIGENELEKVSQAVNSGWVSSKGEFIPKFEDDFANYCGVGYGVATSNGTTALHLALEALGIGQGNEVIIPTLTFAATANAVKYTGATPVLVDVNREYWCMDPAKVEANVSPKTKAIIPVHLYGHPCNMDPILEIAQDNNLRVIEDAAEAHGAKYKGKKVGSFGDISCFSFYGNKIITTGEGGMCITDDEELYEEMRILRDHGMNPQKRYWHDQVGFNYRMTNLQAALGVSQMEKIDLLVKKRTEIRKIYNAKLSQLIEEDRITPPPSMSWAKPICWLYSVLIENGKEVRNSLIDRLAKFDIETRPFFYPLHEMPPYKDSENRYPISSYLSQGGISLPTSPSLTQEQIERITDLIVTSLHT